MLFQKKLFWLRMRTAYKTHWIKSSLGTESSLTSWRQRGVDHTSYLKLMGILGILLALYPCRRAWNCLHLPSCSLQDYYFSGTLACLNLCFPNRNIVVSLKLFVKMYYLLFTIPLGNIIINHPLYLFLLINTSVLFSILFLYAI